MKKHKPLLGKTLILIIILLALVLSACGGGGTDANTNNNTNNTENSGEGEVGSDIGLQPGQIVTTNIDTTDGEELYYLLCTKCHGLGGLGDGPSTGSLSTQAGMNLTDLGDLTDDDILQTITEGKNVEMPPWGLILTIEQRLALVEYVRSLGTQ